jgi:hypothetical protein
MVIPISNSRLKRNVKRSALDNSIVHKLRDENLAQKSEVRLDGLAARGSANFATTCQLEGTTPFSNRSRAASRDFFDVLFACQN